MNKIIKVKLNPDQKFKIEKEDKVIFNFENDLDVWSKNHFFLKMKQSIFEKKIILNSFLKFLFLISLFLSDLLGLSFSSVLLDFIVILVFIDWFYFLIKNILIPLINRSRLKKIFKNEQKLELKTYIKNYKKVETNYSVFGKVKWNHKYFGKIKFDFGRSKSTLMNIRYYKKNNEYSYDFVQTFNKGCEPDEIYKIGRGVFNYEKSKGWYETIDITSTKGFFELLN